MSRAGKELEHKTKQAQKLLHMLKEKREKKKIAEQLEREHDNKMVVNVHTQKQADNMTIYYSQSDSFRTCQNPQYITELYFKIFNQNIKDGERACQQLQNFFQNMKKELIKLTEKIAVQDQKQKVDEYTNNKKIKDLESEKNKIKRAYEQVKLKLAEVETKNQQIQQKLESLNTSNIMNTSMAYEGYEEKIKQLVVKLEEKQREVIQVWERNRKYESLISENEKKVKMLEREKTELEGQCIKLQQVREGLIKQIEKGDEGIKKVNRQLQEKRIEEVKAKELRIKQYEQRQQQLKRVNFSYKQANQALKKDQQALVNKISQIENKANNQIQQRRQIQNILKSKNIENKNLKSIIEGQQKKIGDLSKQTKELQKLMDDIRKKEEIRIKQDDLKTLQLNRANLQKQQSQLSLHQQLKNTINLQAKQIQCFASELDKNRIQLKNLRQAARKIDLLEQEKLRIASFLEQKTEQAKQLVSITEQLTVELFRAKEDLEELQSRVQVLREQNLELMKGRQNHITKINVLQSEIIRWQKQVKIKSEEFQKLYTSKQSVLAELNQIKVKFDAKEHQQNDRKAKNIQDRDKLPPTKEQDGELLKIKDQVTTLERKLFSLQQQKAKQKKKYIKMIEDLTLQLNSAYEKLNQMTTLKKQQSQGRDGKTKQGQTREKSVSKLKSYFGFGSKNED